MPFHIRALRLRVALRLFDIEGKGAGREGAKGRKGRRKGGKEGKEGNKKRKEEGRGKRKKDGVGEAHHGGSQKRTRSDVVYLREVVDVAYNPEVLKKVKK
jgi:hypothetical protein